MSKARVALWGVCSILVQEEMELGRSGGVVYRIVRRGFFVRTD